MMLPTNLSYIGITRVLSVLKMDAWNGIQSQVPSSEEPRIPTSARGVAGTEKTLDDFQGRKREKGATQSILVYFSSTKWVLRYRTVTRRDNFASTPLPR